MAESLEILKRKFTSATGISSCSTDFSNQFSIWLKSYKETREKYYKFLMQERLILDRENCFVVDIFEPSFEQILNNIQSFDPYQSTLLIDNPYYISALQRIERIYDCSKIPTVIGMFGNNDDLDAAVKLEKIDLWTTCFSDGDCDFYTESGMYFCAIPNNAARKRSKGV